MTGAVKLVIFDVDGTLVDSQVHILSAMDGAFAAAGLMPPTRDAILSIVGLSLPVAMARLLPGASDLQITYLVEAYKDTFARLRLSGDSAALSPLYPGAVETLARLAAQDDVLLGIATGKSRRGLDHLIEMHGWEKTFQTVQVADNHPSKPHPSMVLQCLADTGAELSSTVIVGDTTYDVEMGRAAGIAAVGVAWGYHDADALRRAGAVRVLTDFNQVDAALKNLWEMA